MGCGGSGYWYGCGGGVCLKSGVMVGGYTLHILEAKNFAPYSCDVGHNGL